MPQQARAADAQHTPDQQAGRRYQQEQRRVARHRAERGLAVEEDRRDRDAHQPGLGVDQLQASALDQALAPVDAAESRQFVEADGLVKVGASVSEGQVLVQVKTVAGLMPAARANGTGKVTEVYVQAGQNLTSGQAVAAISVGR